ncbi:MAG TPA: ribosome small subunit-dependent GTPase A [Planctomycetota bacterium]|nr:ribosome small subunit-dependent GTPase A [Planctomycetota bacterium]
MQDDSKKKLDKAARRKLKKARKTKRTTERDRSWQDSLLTDQEDELASTFKRIVSRHDRRRREVDLAREALREMFATEPPPGAVEGVVIEIVPGGCIVQSGSDTVRCVLRGLLKSLETKEQNVIAVGDRVAFLRVDDSTAVVERVYPRRTILSRKYMEREHVVAVNVDQLAIVVSVAAPPLRTGLIDRYLVAAGKGELEPVIAVNKIDLAEDDSHRAIMQVYTDLGYRVIYCSVETGEGLDDVRNALAGKTSILAGQSGAGKSSILNALQPGLKLRVGDVSEATSKGIHTTTSVRLLALEFGGYVVDTPGIREFALWDVSRKEVPHYFREFHAYLGTCRLRGCTHTHEPGCEVKAALEQGAISRERYESYFRLYESLEK